MAYEDVVDREFLLNAPMLADVWRQPSVMLEIAERIDEIKDFFDAFLAVRKPGRLYVFGSGDGLFAARAAGARAASFVGVSGLEMLANVAPTLKADDSALAVSMSGNVDRTVEAAEAVLKRGSRCAALVNGNGGRLGALDLPLFSIAIRDIAPFLCGTSSYLATLEILHLISAISRGHVVETVEAIRNTAEKLNDLLPKLNSVCQEIAAEIASTLTGVRILSVGGEGLASADYGAAKLVELTRLRPFTDDIEEFAHRQFWSADSHELVIYLPNSVLANGVASQSAEALGEMGFSTLSIGPERYSATATRWSIQFGDLNNGEDAYFLIAVTLQLLAYYLAIAGGFDPNTRRHLVDDELRFKVSRKLTRRHLLGN